MKSKIRTIINWGLAVLVAFVFIASGIFKLSGAMAVHFVSGQPVGVLVFIEILIWTASAFRFPELTARLLRPSQEI